MTAANRELEQLTTDEGNQRQLVAYEKAKYIYTDEDDVEHITAMGEIYMIEKEISSIVADEEMTD